jgi:hypothetical protein
LALVVVINPTKEQILLYLPNDFSWRYHFGCLLQATSDDMAQVLWSKARVKCESLEKIDAMLFSFHGGEADPMRVSVFQALAKNENGPKGEDGSHWMD